MQIILINQTFGSSSEGYESNQQRFSLVENIIEQYFRTEWYGLNTEDYSLYTEKTQGKKHQKVYLEKSTDKFLIYDGIPLTFEEIQCKLKHVTRVDSKLD